MALVNGFLAQNALMNFVGAYHSVREVKRRLAQESANGTLTIEHANQYHRTLANLLGNLSQGTPTDFPRMDEYAQVQLGDDAFSYAKQYADLVAGITELQAAVDTYLAGAGLKARTLSSAETEPLRTAVAGVVVDKG